MAPLLLWKSDWVLRAIRLASLALTLAPSILLAQSAPVDGDRSVMASIAPYSGPVRDALLQASQYPQTLIQLQQDQIRTQQIFQTLIGHFDQKKQGWFYELTRYPDVMHTLATQPVNLSQQAVRLLLPPNPSDELETAAWKIYHNQHGDLIQADNLNQEASRTFAQTLQPLDAPTQAAFRQLVELPDVLGLLTDHLDMTRQLGEQYRANGSAMTQQLTALHDSLDVQNQYELEAYQQEMASNPQAKQELSQAAQAYAKANGYSIPPVPADNNQNTKYGYSNYGNPYSYWFGYPGWYGSPLWYPGAYWANFGFGYGGFGLFGFPTFGFSNWFFNGGYYHTYPTLYRQFGNYYRRNVAQNRVLGSVNSGFMGVAHPHFNPNKGNRLNFLTSPGTYNRSNNPVNRAGGNRASGQVNQVGRRMGTFSQPNASSYHSQGWGGGGFGRRGLGGGGFHGGGHR